MAVEILRFRIAMASILLRFLPGRLCLLTLLSRVHGDINFPAFSRDADGKLSHMRLLGGSRIDYYSTEFNEFCAEENNPPIRPQMGMSQRFEHPEFRNDPNEDDLPEYRYLDDTQLDNPNAGFISHGLHTEVVVTKAFIADNDILPLPHNRTQLCHYALRLTPALNMRNTASWYKFKQSVAYGFVTEFHFRVLHRNKECIEAGLALTTCPFESPFCEGWCQEVGGDGFAFVIQNFGRKAVGSQVNGMGYGFKYNMAIEFDMYRNSDFEEISGNHISVHVPATEESSNTANHYLAEIAHSDDIPPLTDGTHVVRIEYDPRYYSWDDLGRTWESDNNHQFVNGQVEGRAGLLTIDLDGRRVIAVPVDINRVAKIDGMYNYQADPPMPPSEDAYDESGGTPGRAWVGFTSSTSYSHWQAADILSWTFEEKPRCPVAGAAPETWHLSGPSAFPLDSPHRGGDNVMSCRVDPGAENPATCGGLGEKYCRMIIRNIGRKPIKLSAQMRWDKPFENHPCEHGMLEWDMLHPYFLGCRRELIFTYDMVNLQITTLDGTRSLEINDKKTLGMTPTPFMRRSIFENCVMEHRYDLMRLYFAECNCEYCVRLLTLQQNYAVFYNDRCSARYNLICPCFEASEVAPDTRGYRTDPLKMMRLHVCRGCVYPSQCAQMLKVATCEKPPYQTYVLGNPVAPVPLAAGFTNLSRDRGRVSDGRLGGDACVCEPEVQPYRDPEIPGKGMCPDSAELDRVYVAELDLCALKCKNTPQCSFLTYWDDDGECRAHNVCDPWQPCTTIRCTRAAVYRMAPLGNYIDTRGFMQEYRVFPLRLLQTTEKACFDCLHLYDDWFCYHSCGPGIIVPYLHWPGGQACATCIFAGNRLHELTMQETSDIKACVYEATRQGNDPWVVCNSTATRIGKMPAIDMFNGVSTHFLSECPGRPYSEIGAVCVPNVLAIPYYGSQVLSRMAAINNTVWSPDLECLNAVCHVVPRNTCYKRLARWYFDETVLFNAINTKCNITNDKTALTEPYKCQNISGTGYRGADVITDYVLVDEDNDYRPGYLVVNKQNDFGVLQEQYAVSDVLPFALENYTLEAWIEIHPDEAVLDVAAGKPIEVDTEWREDYDDFNAVDGNMATYWSSQLGTVGDLALNAIWWMQFRKTASCEGAVIYWFQPAGDFHVDVSMDNESWSVIYDQVGNTDTITTINAFFQANYLRIVMTRAAVVRQSDPGIDQPVYSIFEFEALTDMYLSRLKPTLTNYVWDLNINKARDNDNTSFWATYPGSENASLYFDFGSLQGNISMMKLHWRFLPQQFSIWLGTKSCYNERPTLQLRQFSDAGVADRLSDDTTWSGQCLLIEVDQVRLIWGEYLAGLFEVEVYKEGVNIAPNATYVAEPTNYQSVTGTYTLFDNSGYYIGDISVQQSLNLATAYGPAGDSVQWRISSNESYYIVEVLGSSLNGLVGGVQGLILPPDGNIYFDDGAQATFHQGSASSDYISHLTPVSGALDGDPTTWWLVDPEIRGKASLILDLGEEKLVIAIKVFWAEVDSFNYYASTFKISVGTSPTALTQIDSVTDNFEKYYRVQLFEHIRYVKVEVLAVMFSNPGGKLGIEDIVVHAASDNVAAMPATTAVASNQWADCQTCSVSLNGSYRIHGSQQAVDGDLTTWWGAPLGVQYSANDIIDWTVTLNEPRSMNMVVIRWRYPAERLSVWCGFNVSSSLQPVGFLVDNFDYLTPVVFGAARECRVIQIVFTFPVEVFAGEGIMGVQEIELYSTEDNLALNAYVQTTDGQEDDAQLTADASDVSKWASKNFDPVNLTYDLGSIKGPLWGLRTLWSSSLMARGFEIHISDNDVDYRLLKEYTDNEERNLYTIPTYSFYCRYIKVNLIKTQRTAFSWSLRTLAVYGSPNEALEMYTWAPKSWNHTGQEACDGKDDTFWVAEPLASTAVVQVDLERDYFVGDGVHILWKFPARRFSVWFSLNATIWELLYEVADNVANYTEIQTNFVGRYVKIDMVTPDLENGDGSYAIWSFDVIFNPNLANGKWVGATHTINASRFAANKVIDRDESTLWMPQQDSDDSSVVIDLLGDYVISRFQMRWRFPPVVYELYYEDVNDYQWYLLQTYVPENSFDNFVHYDIAYDDGFVARRIKVQVTEVYESNEGKICALREVYLSTYTRSNEAELKPVEASSEITGNPAWFGNDGNERGTYWMPYLNPTEEPVWYRVEVRDCVVGGQNPLTMGRMSIWWRWAPGTFTIKFWYDFVVGWYTVWDVQDDTNLFTDFFKYRQLCTFQIDISPSATKTTPIGMFDVAVYPSRELIAPAVGIEEAPWNGSVWKVNDRDTGTYWMAPPFTTLREEGPTTKVVVAIDLGTVYNIFDIFIWYVYLAQGFTVWVSSEGIGINEYERKMTSTATWGRLRLETRGVAFAGRYIRVEITKSYEDNEGFQLGTSLRDISVFQFRNLAQSAPTSSDNVWSYPPEWVLDIPDPNMDPSSVPETYWMSKFNAEAATLIIDLGEEFNVAGMLGEWKYPPGYFRIESSLDNVTYEEEYASGYAFEINVPPTNLKAHFLGRYVKIYMDRPRSRIFHPDLPDDFKAQGYVFALSKFEVYEHTGGGGAVGIQNEDGSQFNTIVWGQWLPGEWMLGSETDPAFPSEETACRGLYATNCGIFSNDSRLSNSMDIGGNNPPGTGAFKEDEGNPTHIVVTFETVVPKDPANRRTRIAMYRNGFPYGQPYEKEAPRERLSQPNKTRMVFGVRSTLFANDSADPTKITGFHGMSHSPFFWGKIHNATIIENALEVEEVAGLYSVVRGGEELGCHCYDACPYGVNRFNPSVPIPCSGQGACLRNEAGLPLANGRCECLPGYSGDNCQQHCSELSSWGCCEIDDDCPPGHVCDARTKACNSDMSVGSAPPFNYY
jgi:hypothetical protein